MPCTFIRYDDFSAISNTDLERKVFHAVAEAGAKITVAVVPFVAELEWELRGPIRLLKLPLEKVRLLREFLPTTAEVALHGYCHQAISRTSGLMEFGDRITRDAQLARLRDGKAYLEDVFGVQVTTFVPPWNEYGKSTLWAAKKACFEVISADAWTGPLQEGLTFAPASCGSKCFLAALNTAKDDATALVCMLLHEFDFKECESPIGSLTLAELQEMLSVAGVANRWSHFSCSLANEHDSFERARLNQELRRALSSPLRHIMSRSVACVYWSSPVALAKIRWLNRVSLLLKPLLGRFLAAR